ncbi:MAG: nickel pincer cofactor biosynthesis protein LarB [Coriobacteriia bacterium]|nr:nickel pincer cofactor biosynthesis protein LarB [Coriobacteriia bacterium]
MERIASEDLGYARVDHDRARRQGAGEVVYGEGKTAEQVAGIMASLWAGGQRVVLATRMEAGKAQDVRVLMEQRVAAAEAAGAADAGVLRELAVGLRYLEVPRILMAGEYPEPDGNGVVVVACAGTSDLPVAEEAACTAQALGNRVQRLYDVGVAGIHRLLEHEEDLTSAQVVIAVAGMEGALPSVVGGLTKAPVLAVPTSVGYGASFGGLSALLGMLNSCASGVSVVNIDNGFGAGFQASLINHLKGGA